MRAFVTGATGFIGRHLVCALHERGWEVTALARNEARARTLPAEATPVVGDLADEDALRSGLSGATVVFHLAAAMKGPWEAQRRITVEGTERLLRLSRAAGVRRFVHTSSIMVYDKRGLANGQPIDESWPLLAPDPAAGPYARSKIESEHVVRQAQDAQGSAADMEIVVLRVGLVYGPGRVFFEHLGAIVGRRLVAVGDGARLLPLVHVDSVVDAMILCATSPAAAGRTYNVVDDGSTSRADYLRFIEELTGARHPVRHLPVGPVATACDAIAMLRRRTGSHRIPDVSGEKLRTRAVEARHDTSRLRADTGWQPRLPLREGLAGALGIAVGGPAVRIERVGVIGAGGIAGFHLDALRRIQGVRVTGILDTDPNAGQETAARFGVAAHFTDAARFYEEARPQIVHVLTPPQTHAPLGMDALRRGVHVLLEKPACLTVAECDALLEAADAAGLTVGIDENFAHEPLVQEARGLIDRGAVGEIVHVSAFHGFDVRRSRHFRQDSGASSWKFQLAGGELEDLLPHSLSVTLLLAGGALQPTYWRAIRTGRLAIDIDDELRLNLARDSLTAEVVMSFTARPDDFTVMVYGTRATMRLDLQNMLLDLARIGPGPRAIARGARVVGSGLRTLGQTAANALSIATRRARPPGSPLHLIRAHYDALAAGREPPGSLARARRIVEITRAIWPMPAEALHDVAQPPATVIASPAPVAEERP